jgi:long-chain acyl-CoA synthetase
MTRGAGAGVAGREEGDLAWLFYTSGTTGRPKGVMITHGMLAAMSLCYLADVDRVDPRDAALYAAPMSHGAGLYNLVHVLKGCRHVCPPSGGFDAGEVLDLAARIGPLSMFMAPTMVRRLTDAARARGDRAERIRTIVYGGGPMYLADIVEAVDWFGPKFVQIYGQGECPMGITALSREDVADRSHPRWRARLGSVGRAQAAVEVAIGDGAGRFLAPGETGEIMVRGRTVMPGYWENPEATARTLAEGWLMTGDVGRLDRDGYLTLTDRSKDVIISGGANIYPREVEEVILAHPDVREVSVVGRPDPEWGELVVAFVVPVPGADPDLAALDRFCREHIARFKRPKLWRVLEELPKNNYGKVLKTELRRMLEEER